MAPTTHPKGKIPFIKLSLLVFSSFVIPLENLNIFITNYQKECQL